MGAMTTAAMTRVERGEVFTRRWVVETILDLVGYTPDRDLTQLKLIEPAIGSGPFIILIVERLVESALRHNRKASDLTDALHGFDLQINHVEIWLETSY